MVQGLFPARFSETVAVTLGELELAAYEAVMEYASTWYGKDSVLALSIYGKRAASCLPAAIATLGRRLELFEAPQPAAARCSPRGPRRRTARR